MITLRFRVASCDVVTLLLSCDLLNLLGDFCAFSLRLFVGLFVLWEVLRRTITADTIIKIGKVLLCFEE